MKQLYEYTNALMISSSNSIAASLNDLNYIVHDTESKFVAIALAILIYQSVY